LKCLVSFVHVMKAILSIEHRAIEEDGFHIFIESLVNGKPARLLVDTGASKTVFDEMRLQQFMDTAVLYVNDKLSTGLGTNSMESKLAQITRMAFKEVVVENVVIAALDLSHVNQSYAEMDMPPIDGVMGGDLLTQCSAEINYSKRQLVLWSTV
jgi:hypothetical protein